MSVFIVRPLDMADPSDRNFVLDTWLESAASGFAYRGIPTGEYKRQMRPLIASALDRCVVFGVADKARPERMIGWSVSDHGVTDDDQDTTTIHYVYVKHDWRRRGVGTALATDLGVGDIHGPAVSYSHANTTSVRIGPKKGWQYNPFTFWRP